MSENSDPLPDHRQQRLLRSLQVIDGFEELIDCLIARARKRPIASSAGLTEEHRIKACESRVWIVPNLEGNHYNFAVQANNGLVSALANLMCEIYSGAAAGEIRCVEPWIFEKLGITANLSPVRQAGLVEMRQHILAATGLGRGEPRTEGTSEGIGSSIATPYERPTTG